MVKSEKKKYTKKNISNKVHKSKKNSGTAKKKAFRKSKKEGGFLNDKKKEEIDFTMMKNRGLVKKFIKLEKEPLKNIEEMIETKNSLMKNNSKIILLNSGKNQIYQNTNSLIVDLSLFKIPEQPTTTPSSTEKEKPNQLAPLPECWKQVFDKQKNRSYVRSDGKTADANNRPLPDAECPGDKKEAAEEEAKRIRLQKKAARQAESIRLQKKAAEKKKKAEEAFLSYVEEEKAKAAAKEEEGIDATWKDSQSAGK